jgi:hypothetical protein
MQTSSGPASGSPGTTFAIPSLDSDVDDNMTGVAMSLSIQGNGTILPEILDHPTDINLNGLIFNSINIEVPQAVTASTLNISSSSTGIVPYVGMDDISTLSTDHGPPFSMIPDPYSGGGMAPPPHFLLENLVVEDDMNVADNRVIEEGMNVTDNAVIEEGMNMMNISGEGVATQHSMVKNSGVDGGVGTKKPSKMRPRNTLTPRWVLYS